MEAGEDGAARVLGGLTGVDADLVGLEEFQTDMQQAIRTDSTLSSRYPYRVFVPHDGSLGTALLSRFPIVEQQTSTPTDLHPRCHPAAGSGRSLVVYVMHPAAS